MADSDSEMVLDIFPGKIEARLSLPPEGVGDAIGRLTGTAELRDALSPYLQSRLAFSTDDNRSLEYDLDGAVLRADGSVEASLSIYPPNGVAPQRFVIAGSLLSRPGGNRTMAVYLRRDVGEMRFGFEPAILLGKFDYFHKVLTIEREPLHGLMRIGAALAVVSHLLLSSGAAMCLVVLLLVQSVVAQNLARAAFAWSVAGIAAFAVGASAALLGGTMVNPDWNAVGLVVTLIVASWITWKPSGWVVRSGVAAAGGWLVGVSWNGVATGRQISGADTPTLLLLAGACLVVLTGLALLLFPTILLLMRRFSRTWLQRGAAVCGIIVALHVLTTIAH